MRICYKPEMKRHCPVPAACLIALVFAGCGGATTETATTPASSRAVPVVVAPPPEPEGLVAYAPDGFDESLIYAGFEAIRASAEMAPVTRVFGRYLESRRPDVARLFTTPGLHLQGESGHAVLASPVGRWSWVMTIEYAGADGIAEALAAAAAGEGRQEGDLAVREVLGWETAPPLIAHPTSNRVVLGTPDGMEAAGRSRPRSMSFVNDADLVAWHVRGGTGFLGSLGLEHLAPREMTAHLTEPSDGEGGPLAIDAVLSYDDAAAAEEARAQLLRHLDGFRNNLLVRLSGFGRVIDSARITQNGATLEVRVRFTGTQAAMLADLLLQSQSVPMGMEAPK
jgi:hypothetical protein